MLFLGLQVNKLNVLKLNYKDSWTISIWRRSGIFIVNFEHVQKYSKFVSLFSTVYFEHVIACWVSSNSKYFKYRGVSKTLLNI